MRPQNRGQYLAPPFHGQFARLGPWLAAHEDRLFDALGTHLMAFGEWCAARHSLDYATLPDWWLLFDIYDRTEGRFWSTVRRDAWARLHGLTVVPRLHSGRVGMAQLRQWISNDQSRWASLKRLIPTGATARWSGINWIERCQSNGAYQLLDGPKWEGPIVQHRR